MYYTESERLAKQNPHLAVVIERIDAQLQGMGKGAVIREGDLASLLNADPNQIEATLDLLVAEGVLRREDMVECGYCQMPVERSEYDGALEEDGEYRCSDCDRPLEGSAAVALTTYRPGEKWKEPLKLQAGPGVTAVDASLSSRTGVGTVLDEEAWYTYVRLAEVFDVGKDALRKRLDSYRKKSLDGWKEDEDRRPREPKYLFRLRAVKGIIADLKSSS